MLNAVNHPCVTPIGRATRRTQSTGPVRATQLRPGGSRQHGLPHRGARSGLTTTDDDQSMPTTLPRMQATGAGSLPRDPTRQTLPRVAWQPEGMTATDNGDATGGPQRVLSPAGLWMELEGYPSRGAEYCADDGGSKTLGTLVQATGA